MKKITKYLLNNFFQSFLSLFFILFFLVSVITFIRMSNITSSFTVSFGDLFILYLYLLPEMMIYILPITFFIALTLAIYKMSQDNECIVLFTMSMSPKKITKLFFLLSSLVSIALLINALVFKPLSDQLSKNFLQEKKLEANINIKSSKFGQKFSSWNVFVNKLASKNEYKDIILFKRDNEKGVDTFIISDNANIDTNNSLFGLVLNNGAVYNLKQNELKLINYEKLKITYAPNIKEVQSDDIIDYWKKASTKKKRAKHLSLSIFLAMFPFVSYLFAITFGIVNTRNESSNIYIKMFLVIIVFYTLVSIVSTKIPLWGTPTVLILFYIASIVLFRKKILTRY